MKLTRLLLAVSAAIVTAAAGCSGSNVVIPSGGDVPDGSADGAKTDDGGSTNDAIATGDGATPNDGATETDAGPDGATDGGKACNVTTPNDCGPNAYCDSPTCTVGTCKARPAAEKDGTTPVCGCDDVTYWNETLAHVHGVSVKANAACTAGKTCGGIANLKCPGSTFCNYEGASLAVCAASDAAGKCWGLPSSCPNSGGAKFRACGAACNGRCQQVKAETTFYSDITCP